MKGLDCGAWGAFSFPKGTPQAIVQTARQGDRATPSTRRPCASASRRIGVTVIAPDRRSPEYLTKFVQSEIARWGVPIKASGVSIE